MDKNHSLFVQIGIKIPTFGRKCLVSWNKNTIFAAEIINGCVMETKEKLIGRERECEELKWAMDSHRSELIVNVFVCP